MTMRTVRARDVMSAPVIMIDVDDSIWQAWSVMLDSGLRHLVVCDRNHCVGVLDDRTLFSLWPADPFGVRYTSVRRLIPPRTTCVLPDTSLSQVARVMLDQRLDVVPVTAADGTVLGVVTSRDLTSAVAHHDLVIPELEEAAR